MMWVRETLEDLTASEFASSLESSSGNSNKRDVDFEKLLNKLNARITEMCVAKPSATSSVETKNRCVILETQPPSDSAGFCYVLEEGQGMSSVVYADDQREA